MGQLLTCTVQKDSKSGRVVRLSTEHSVLLKSQLHQVSNVGSLVPGQSSSVLVTAVLSTGLNVKVCGFFDGTIDVAHLGLKGEDIDEKYKIGKKVRSI